jgi:tRNA (adenine58-N1)-methyltransferase non-catalytic subunit
VGWTIDPVCLVISSIEIGEFEVPAEDNRNYVDSNSAQRLNSTDIAGLRESGVSGKEIIQKLVENSETWEAKTEFSKQKYLKKKQQKYMPRVRFVKCTAESLCRTYRVKNPSKICNMREDTLGQLLNYANIYATAQVLVVDTCMGLITGAIAERQSGLGRVIAGYEGQQVPNDILRRFNFGEVLQFYQAERWSVYLLTTLTWVCRQEVARVDPLVPAQHTQVH